MIRLRKELWFGLSLMAVLVVGAAALLLTAPVITNGHIGLLMLTLVVSAIMLGFPTAFTLMGMGMVFTWIAYERDANKTLDLMVQAAYKVMANDVLISVPLFVFMGYLVERANLIEKLFRSLHLALARVPGSLAVATLVTCAVFATATGIVGAVVTLMGLLALPPMLRAGYAVPLAAGSITAGGCLGILIPPSVLLIVYGATAGVSVVQLYAGAFFPGLMLTALYILYIVLVAKLKPALAPPLSPEDRRVPLPPPLVRARVDGDAPALPGLFRLWRDPATPGAERGWALRQIAVALMPLLLTVAVALFTYEVSTAVRTADTTDLPRAMGDAAQPLPSLNDTRAAGGLAEPPIGGLAEPPSGGLAEPPSGGLAEPPSGGLAEPPSGGLAEPPVSTLAEPPAVVEPPPDTLGEPPAGGLSEPPGDDALAAPATADPSASTLADPPGVAEPPGADATPPAPAGASRNFWIGIAAAAVALGAYYLVLNFNRFEVFKMLLTSFFPLLLLIVSVLGSIVYGLATPTEAAAVGALGGFLLAIAYRQLTFGRLKEAVFLTAKTSAMVCWLFVGSSIFSAAFALLGGQELVEQWVLGMDLSKTQFLILSQVIIFILGWPLEWTEIIVIFMPIFVPLLDNFGVDPLFFGLLVALNLQTAFLSPPVAMAAFYLKGVAPPHVTLNQIFLGMLPFMAIQVLAIFLLYMFPQIGLWLPQVLYR